MRESYLNVYYIFNLYQLIRKIKLKYIHMYMYIYIYIYFIITKLKIIK